MTPKSIDGHSTYILEIGRSLPNRSVTTDLGYFIDGMWLCAHEYKSYMLQENFTLTSSQDKDKQGHKPSPNLLKRTILSLLIDK
jgi:hypothetical protein